MTIMKTLLKILNLLYVYLCCTYAFAGPEADKITRAFEDMKSNGSNELLLTGVNLNDLNAIKCFRTHLEQLGERKESTCIKLKQCTVGTNFLREFFGRHYNVLHLNENFMDPGTLEVCLDLIARKSFSELHIELVDYRMSLHEICFLETILSDNEPLKTLHLKGKSCESAFFKRITERLIGNTQLTTFIVENEKFDGNYLNDLAVILRNEHGPHIEHLGFCGGNLGPGSLTNLGVSLPSTLKTLSFGYKSVEEEDEIESFVSQIAAKRQLKFIPMGPNLSKLSMAYRSKLQTMTEDCKPTPSDATVPVPPLLPSDIDSTTKPSESDIVSRPMSDRQMLRPNPEQSDSEQPRKRQRQEPSAPVVLMPRELPDEAHLSALKEANKELAARNLAIIKSLREETPERDEIISYLVEKEFVVENREFEPLPAEYVFSKLDIDKAKIEFASREFLEKLLYSLFSGMPLAITDEISKNDLTLLGEVLKKQVPINSLKIERRGDRVPEGIIAYIADALKCNQSLKKLDLSCCKIFNVSGDGPIIKLLGDVLRTSCLEELDLSHNSIEFINAIAEALKNNTFLKILNLSCNNIKVGGAQALGEALKTNNILHELKLSYNRIGDTGFGVLMYAPTQNKSSNLKVLNLLGHRNRITVDRKPLNKGLTLETLVLTFDFEDYCCTKSEVTKIEPLLLSISKDDIEVKADYTRSIFEDFMGKRVDIDTAKSLLERCGIERSTIDAANSEVLVDLVNSTLNGSKFTITDLVAQKDLEVLCKALESQVPLRSLKIENTEKLRGGRKPRQFNVLQVIALALRYNVCLKVLDLSYYCAYCDEIEILAWSLRYNHALEKLDLSYNNIGGGGLEVLAKALECNKGLTFLDLRHNDIKPVSIDSLRKALRRNSTLKKIDLSCNRCITSDMVGGDPRIEFRPPKKTKCSKEVSSKWFH